MPVWVNHRHYLYTHKELKIINETIETAFSSSFMTTGATRKFRPSGTPTVFSEVRVTRSLALCVYFVDRCSTFSF